MKNRLGEECESKPRSLDEIQAAHDRIVAILLGDVPNPEMGWILLKDAANVLCWVLQHSHNTEFQEILDAIDQRLGARGYRLTKAD